jgi:hypothetical protein
MAFILLRRTPGLPPHPRRPSAGRGCRLNSFRNRTIDGAIIKWELNKLDYKAKWRIGTLPFFSIAFKRDVEGGK